MGNIADRGRDHRIAQIASRAQHRWCGHAEDRGTLLAVEIQAPRLLRIHAGGERDRRLTELVLHRIEHIRPIVQQRAERAATDPRGDVAARAVEHIQAGRVVGVAAGGQRIEIAAADQRLPTGGIHTHRAIALVDRGHADVAGQLADQRVTLIQQRIGLAADVGLDDLLVEVGNIADDAVDAGDGTGDLAADLALLRTQLLPERIENGRQRAGAAKQCLSGRGAVRRTGHRAERTVEAVERPLQVAAGTERAVERAGQVVVRGCPLQTGVAAPYRAGQVCAVGALYRHHVDTGADGVTAIGLRDGFGLLHHLPAVAGGVGVADVVANRIERHLGSI